MLSRIQAHRRVWSARTGGCVTKPACLSHYCVPQDTTVPLGPLLPSPALRSVSCFDASLPSLGFWGVLIAATFSLSMKYQSALHNCLFVTISPGHPGGVLRPARWQSRAALPAVRGWSLLQQSGPLGATGSL